MLAFFIPMFAMVPSYIMTVRLLSQRAKFVQNNSLLLTNPSNGGSGGGTSLNHHHASSKVASSLETTGEIQPTTRQQLRDDNLTCAPRSIVGSSSPSSRNINHNKTTVILRHQTQGDQLMEDDRKVGLSKRVGGSCKQKSASVLEDTINDKEQRPITKKLCLDIAQQHSNQNCTCKSSVENNHNIKLLPAASQINGCSKNCTTYLICKMQPSSHSRYRDNHHLRNCCCSKSCSKLKSSTSCNLTTLARKDFGGSDKIKSSTDLTDGNKVERKLPPQQHQRQVVRLEARKCHRRCCRCSCDSKSPNVDLLDGELRVTRYIDEDDSSASGLHINRCLSAGSALLTSSNNSPKRNKCCKIIDSSSCSKCNQANGDEKEREEDQRVASRGDLEESTVLNSEHCHKMVGSNNSCKGCTKCCTLNTNCNTSNLKIKSTYAYQNEQQQFQHQQNKLDFIHTKPARRESLEQALHSNKIGLSSIESLTMIESDLPVPDLDTTVKQDSNATHLKEENSLLSASKCNSAEVDPIGNAASTMTDKMKVVVNERGNHNRGEQDHIHRQNIHQTIAQKNTSRFNHSNDIRRGDIELYESNEITNVGLERAIDKTNVFNELR